MQAHPTRSSSSNLDYPQRLLHMVHELHKLGYERLRIAPGMSPSGCYWRCSITHVGNIRRSHGARLCYSDRGAARYTTGQHNEYFRWTDARQDTARELASKFVARFPRIAHLGVGEDRQYVDWYLKVLEFGERGQLPIAYADWFGEPDCRWLPTLGGGDQRLPMPPPGECVRLDDQ